MTITYNLKVESGGGGSVSPTAQNNIAAETPVSVKATPNNGYVFFRWSLTSGLAQFTDANSASTSVLLGWNATIKANFTPHYTVTFNGNGATGTTPAAVSQILYGDSITLPTLGDMVKIRYERPDSIHYRFGGWNTNSSGTGTNYNADSKYRVTGSITLYAKWILVYTVKFNINNATSGDTPVAITADSGTSITLPGKGDLARTGYTFDGWKDNNGTGTGYNAGASYMVRNNITLYVKWTAYPTYTVTYNGNGTTANVPASVSTDSGSTITLSEQGSMTISGYNFGGWNTSSGGTGTNYVAGTSYRVTGNVTLYAKWTAYPTYTVTYNGNGTTVNVPAAVSTDSGSTITISGHGSMTRAGYNFGGWNTSSGGTGTNYAAGSSYKVTGNVTLYAKWTEIVVTGTTFTDTRDNKTYKSVTIGSQTWMAENLNYQTADSSWCYGGSADSCNKYGRLYTWSAAMQGASSSITKPSGVRGACPVGWHLPSRAEWEELVTFVGGSSTAGNYLKSTGGWYNNGSWADTYGFSALPGGFRLTDGSFFNAGFYGYWWTATESLSGSAYYRNMNNINDYVYEDYEAKRGGFSVRCLGN
jgi:uncharacterized protein (TIGR02145 family)/uncharacterized repeat protein (TIGR02543 family)